MEGEGYGPDTCIPMSVVQWVRLFRARRKVEAARSLNNATNSSTDAVPEQIDIAREDVSQLMDINVSQIYEM